MSDHAEAIGDGPEYVAGRRDGYAAGYSRARVFYGTTQARAERILEAWNAAPDPRAHDAIVKAWPELARAIESLKEWQRGY